MSDLKQSVVCQRCGRGFVLTTSYCNFLARRGAKMTTPVLCMTCFLREGPLPKQHGKVKWFNARKHYGFIVTDKGQDVFFHQKQLLAGERAKPHEGQAVLFHKRYAVKGPEALNVELV